MGGGLQEMAGKKANRTLEILTSVPIVGILVGAVVTMVVQSSSLVTVMIVSLTNSAMMNLKQAASVIIGANIGTTLTAQLVAFRITDLWVYFAAVGFAVYFFAKPKHIKTAGHVMFAFAMLLLGMMLMSDAMRPLRNSPGFINLIVMFSDNRFLGMLVGIVFTAVVQSSTAVTGIIIAMTMEDLIPLNAALPLILGANIGTCITAILASIGSSVSAKRAAAIHVVFNTVGAFIFLVILPQFEWAVLAISPYGDVPRQAANAHTLFSVVSAVIFMPFINQFVKLVTLIVPDRTGTEAEEKKKDTQYLDWKVVSTPSFAIPLAQRELLRMADLAGLNMQLSVEGFLEKKRKKLRQSKKLEERVDRLEKEIVSYLAAISQVSMGKHMSILHAGLLHAANDIERVSDHARNISRSARIVIENQIEFPREAILEIEDIFMPVAEIYKTALKSVQDNDTALVPKVKELEAEIDTKEKKMRESHIQRMAEGQISADSGIIFLEILSNFERIGDHSVNISHLPQGRL